MELNTLALVTFSTHLSFMAGLKKILNHAVGPGLTIALLPFLWMGARRLSQILRLRFKVRNRVAHFELKPSGNRPETLAEIVGEFNMVVSNNLPSRWMARSKTLSIHRWTDGRETHLGLSIYGNQPSRDAAQIARAIGCQVVEIGTSPLPETKCYAYAYRSSLTAQVGASYSQGESTPPDALAKAIGQQLDDVKAPAFLTVTFSPMRNRELNGLKAWRVQLIRDARDTAGVAGNNAWLGAQVAARGMVVAGAPDQATANTLSNIGPSLPDFESGLSAHSVTDRSFGVGLGILGVILGVGLHFLGGFVGNPRTEVLGMVVGIAGAVVLVVLGSNQLRLPQRRMKVWMAAGLAPLPLRPFLAMLRSRMGGPSHTGIEEASPDHSGKRLPHPYRLVRRALVLLPQQLAVIAALPPLSDTSTAVTGSRSVAAPLQVREAKGSRIGFDAEGNGIQIPDSNRSSGVMVIGDPGQGKSTILLWLFASDLLARMREWHQNKRFSRAIIWFETKGEGAARALKTAERVGYDTKKICVIDVTSTSGPQLDLVDYNDPIGSSKALAEAMRYAYEDNDIRAASEAALRLTMALALTIPDEVLLKAGEDPKQGFLSVAYKLVGGDPVRGSREKILSCVSQYLDEAGSVLGDIESTNAVGDNDAMNTPLGISYREYKTLERSRAASTEDVFAPPRNKIEKLLGAETLWYYDPSRPHISFQQILRHHMAVIINFGSKDNASFTDELRSLLGGVATYLLWQVIKQECDDWDAKGDSITVFSDEVADISGDKKKSESIDVIRLMHDSGRTRGARQVFATQRFNQLGDSTISALRSFDTKVYLRLEDYEQAAEAARDVSGTSGDAFTEDDFRRLPKLHGIARVRIGDALPAPFTLLTHYDDLISPENITTPALSGDSTEAA